MKTQDAQSCFRRSHWSVEKNQVAILCNSHFLIVKGRRGSQKVFPKQKEEILLSPSTTSNVALTKITNMDSSSTYQQTRALLEEFGKLINQVSNPAAMKRCQGLLTQLKVECFCQFKIIIYRFIIFLFIQVFQKRIQ